MAETKGRRRPFLVAVLGREPEAAEWAALARSDCRGARFVRCALQVNPFDYLGRHGKQSTFADEISYNDALIAACRENGIEAIGVTDHFRIDSAKGLLGAAAEAGIVAFPGIEAVSSDGVHLLVLFESGTPLERIDRFIGKCGIKDGDEDSPLADMGAIELMGMAREWGAITIGAHVASDGGLLRLKGQARINAWRCEELPAVALPGPISDAPDGLGPILRNKDPAYLREHPPAVINANDVCEPGQLGRPEHSCWIKMSEISLRGLRLAFLDHGSRVRLASDEAVAEHAWIVAMRWEGGFLGGQSITFSESLNVLIGGPGAGKSTVIESLRYAFGIEPTGPGAAKDHGELIRHVLGTGASISVLLEQSQPTPTSYVVERSVPHPPVVRSAADGAQLPLRPDDLLPRPEIFSQHEISEIAGDPTLRTALLERYRAVDPARARKLVELSEQLADSRRQIGEVDEAIGRCEARLGALPRIEETLERYKEAGVEEQLGEQSRLVAERQSIADAREELDPLAAVIEELDESLPFEPLPVPDKDEAGAPAVSLALELNKALKARSLEAEKAVGPLGTALAGARADIDAIEAEWRKREAQVNRKLNSTLQKLKQNKIDGQEFIDLREELEELGPVTRERDKLVKRRTKMMTQRERLLVEREKAAAVELRALERAAKKATRSLGGRVRVSVIAEADRGPLRELISGATSGRIKDAIDNICAAPSLSPRGLAAEIRAGAEALEAAYSIPRAQAHKLAAVDEEALMRIEELQFPTETAIELNVAAAGEEERWQRLEHLSKGQKATAILLLLLLESDGPLVVDQPEDDLDNTFISGDIVPTIRREKGARQFLFATHNANIPVLADAELIVGLAATGEAGDGSAEVSEEGTGSIDIESVRTLVEERLEGGHQAFELRRRKYGLGREA